MAAPRCDGLRRIDLASLETRVAPWPAGGSVAAVVRATDGVTYAIGVDGSIRGIDASGGVSETPLLPLSSGGAIIDAAPAPDPDGVYVLASRGFGDGSLYHVDLEARRVESVALAHAIGERDRLAASPDGTALLVTHYGAGIVEVVVGLQAVGELTLPAGITGAAIFTAANCNPPPLPVAVAPSAAVAPAAAVDESAGVPPSPPRPLGQLSPGRPDEWYVDCSAAQSGDGSAEQPWNSIAEAAREVRGGGAGGDNDGRGDVIHVRNGPCEVNGVGFKDTLSGPGPDCLADDAACTVFRGEPSAVEIIGDTAKHDGFLIQGGVDQLKLENFTFIGDVRTDPPNAPFNEPVKVSGGGTDHIVLANISVESGALVHDSGIKILSEGGTPAHDILIDGGTVRGVAGVGYTLGGPPDAPLRNVTLRDTSAIGNGGDGYVVSKDSRGVADAIFERTRAEANSGDGYDIYGAFDSAPEQVTRFIDVIARGNGPPNCEGSSQGVGIKAWHSVEITGATITDNCQSGISLRRSEASGARDTTLAVGTITMSTVTDNAHVGGTQIDLSRPLARYTVTDCTLASTEGKSALSYLRRYACATGDDAGDACSGAQDCVAGPCGTGGSVGWDESTLYRNNNGKLVSFVDRSGAMRDCRNDEAEVRSCDIVGDCNFDFVVLIDEVIKAANILLDIDPVSRCPQIDRDGNGIVSVDELVTAVNAALGETRQIDTDPPPGL